MPVRTQKPKSPLDFGERAIPQLLVLITGMIITLTACATIWLLLGETHFDAGHDGQIIGLVPFLLLLFGMNVTVIAAMYVRNNHVNAQKLARMNDMLREKNQNIQTQMQRTAALYETLRRSERDFAAVINAVNEVIFETDQSGRVVFLNDGWQRLTGLEASDCLGTTLMNYIQEQDRIECTEALMHMFQKPTGHTRMITRVLTSDDKYRSVELIFSLIRTDDDGSKRLIGMMTDIEDRRQAEIALRETERRYRTIVENAVSGLFQVSVDGRFISANPALAKLLGHDTPNDILRDSLLNKNHLYADDKERDLLLRLVKRHGQVKSFEARYKRKNGDVFWGSENLRAVTNEHGDVIYYEGSIDDISKRKEAEITTQQARLESDIANRAKTEFLANMSHELRTPLNAIIGFSDMIHQQSLGKIAEAAYVDFAREINDGGRQLLKIINEILEVSRIELSEKPQLESTVDLRRVCTTCVSLIKGKAEAQKVTIELGLPPQLPTLIGSETAFKQMILNLLHNALAHTPEEGFISIESVLDQDHSVRISVGDTGRGMESEDIRRALQPLNEPHSGLIHSAPRQSGNKTKTFGLSLVRSLVDQHGGRLEIISHKDIGTTATIIIPPSRVMGVLDKNNAGYVAH